MNKPFLRKTSTWLLAAALGGLAMPSFAAEGTPEERAKVLAELDVAIAAVKDASLALESGQANLAAARAKLELADTARTDAEKQLAATEARAARGELTRDQVSADRSLAEAATNAVGDVRADVVAIESELQDSQAKLMAAKTAVEAVTASAAAYLGEAPVAAPVEAPVESPAGTPGETPAE